MSFITTSKNVFPILSATVLTAVILSAATAYPSSTLLGHPLRLDTRRALFYDPLSLETGSNRTDDAEKCSAPEECMNVASY